MINIYKENNKIGGHNNLVLEISLAEFKQITDTYYFSLDNGFLEKDESIKKTNLNIINLLGNWLLEVEKIVEGEFIFLPFDFSDEYLGCLKVFKNVNNTLCISYGITTAYNGVSLSPSEYPNNFELDLFDFLEENIKKIELSFKEFEKSIKNSIDKFNSKEGNIEWLN